MRTANSKQVDELLQNGGELDKHSVPLEASYCGQPASLHASEQNGTRAKIRQICPRVRTGGGDAI